MSDVLHFDEATHTYTVAGRRLPSVTQILKPIGPDFSAILPAVLERKRQIGVDVHLACELDDDDELESCSDELLPYLEAWRKFRRETGAKILANERRLHHSVLRFAGTIDRLAVLHGGEGWLLDLKTSLHPHASYGVQLAGYRLLLSDSVQALATESLKRGTVHLFDDGTYKLKQYQNPNDEACFRALLSVNQWKEANQ